jgi:hypothetical protein
MAMGAISLLVNLLAALVAWFPTPRINAYVARSITLDRTRQTLTFTSASGRSAQNVDLAAAAGVEAERLGDSSRGKRYSVRLTLHAGTGTRTAVSVIDSTSHRTASQLANWLRERLTFEEPNSTGMVGQ